MQKTAVNIMNCKLCLQEKNLCKSHIIPEFAYQSLYDSKDHRFYCLSTDQTERAQTKPTGYYDRLLCKDCEQQIGRYESYASNVFRGRDDLKKEKSGRIIIFSNLNYTIFKLFFLSIIWRASVTNMREFPINLGPHEERIRIMLQKQEPGEQYEYGITAFFNPEMQSLLQKMMCSPEPIKIDGYLFYRFLLSGVFWFIVVSSHSQRFPYKELFLSKEGVLKIIIDIERSSIFIREVAKHLNLPEKIR